MSALSPAGRCGKNQPAAPQGRGLAGRSPQRGRDAQDRECLARAFSCGVAVLHIVLNVPKRRAAMKSYQRAALAWVMAAGLMPVAWAAEDPDMLLGFSRPIAAAMQGIDPER